MTIKQGTELAFALLSFWRFFPFTPFRVRASATALLRNFYLSLRALFAKQAPLHSSGIASAKNASQ
jgi:hypothetical protein